MAVNVTETAGVGSTRLLSFSSTAFDSSCHFLSGSSCLGPNAPLTSGEAPPWGNTSLVTSSSSASHSGRVFTVLTIDFTPPPESVVATVFVPESSEAASETSSSLNNATVSSSLSIMTIVTIAVGSNTGAVQTASLTRVSFSPTSSREVGPLNGSTILTVSPPTSSSTSADFNSSSTSSSWNSTLSSEVSGALTTGPSATGAGPSSNSSSNEAMTSSSAFWSNSTTASVSSLTTASGWLDWNMTAGILTALSQYNISFQATATSENGSVSLASPTITSSSWNISVTTTFPSTTNSTGLSPESNFTTSPTSTLRTTKSTLATESPAITASSNNSTTSWSSAAGSTSLSPNASTICDTNATVAFCASSNAPWLASETAAPTITTNSTNGTGWSMTSMEATTFTTSFVSASGSGSGDSGVNSTSATWHPLVQPHRAEGRPRRRWVKREEQRRRENNGPQGDDADGHHDGDPGQRKREGTSWVRAQMERMFLVL
ncbi:hypothetical protein PV08_01509 [Exophiala spinifera]|uniref:Uncharacterized protein n=1 Tax=Exophiala spinifera TaxID=91928 RepID=A0A0D2BR68_9EURO|nr:uncharacterized protein PV08_01509 [Exophiala spinifera]KIW20930.1 hypothetical protein PV08_01509 [Exophiala spinifera]